MLSTGGVLIPTIVGRKLLKRKRLTSVPTLKEIVERSDTAIGRAFDLSIQLLIVLSLIAFSFETLPNLDPRLKRFLYIFEIATVSVFTAEYVARLFAADRKIAFVTSFFGVIDLLAILPFYLSLGIDLRSIRAPSLFRQLPVTYLFFTFLPLLLQVCPQ